MAVFRNANRCKRAFIILGYFCIHFITRMYILQPSLLR